MAVMQQGYQLLQSKAGNVIVVSDYFIMELYIIYMIIHINVHVIHKNIQKYKCEVGIKEGKTSGINAYSHWYEFL